MTLTPLREHRAAPAPAAGPRPVAGGGAVVVRVIGADPPGRPSGRTLGLAFACLGAATVITTASWQALMPALPSDGGRRPAEYGRRGLSVPCAGLVAALLALAPALPNPPGTVRHVPDIVGSVLLASAVAAGVLAISRGCVWGRLNSRSPGRAAAFAVALTGSLAISRPRRASVPPVRRRSGLPRMPAEPASEPASMPRAVSPALMPRAVSPALMPRAVSPDLTGPASESPACDEEE
ncbi:hypothetical protein [Nonomuraea sp. NPDC002799]